MKQAKMNRIAAAEIITMRTAGHKVFDQKINKGNHSKYKNNWFQHIHPTDKLRTSVN
jgi:hypothetical protein